MKNLYIDKRICSVAPEQPDLIEYEICTCHDGSVVAKAYSEDDAKKIAETLDQAYYPQPLKIHVTGIEWDYDESQDDVFSQLPDETDLELYAKYESDDALGELIADKLSELHGWCVKGCCWEVD